MAYNGSSLHVLLQSIRSFTNVRPMMKFFLSLIKSNTGISSKSFFLVVVTLIGLLLLLVPVICLLVEIFYIHTIRTDLSGMAQYIGAVAALFASAGITKAWSEKWEHKD